ncbi:MAG: YggT family protein [Alphaproteobacteria bacterium]|nr:YggT family protein [Alphaproteobacteria bacterium]
MLAILVDIIVIVLQLFVILLIVQAVLSWLVAFEMVSRRSPIVDSIWRFTTAISDPVLRPIRRFIPPISGVDLSPLVLILLIYLLMRALPCLLLARC